MWLISTWYSSWKIWEKVILGIDPSMNIAIATGILASTVSCSYVSHPWNPDHLSKKILVRKTWKHYICIGCILNSQAIGMYSVAKISWWSTP